MYGPPAGFTSLWGVILSCEYNLGRLHCNKFVGITFVYEHGTIFFEVLVPSADAVMEEWIDTTARVAVEI
jgi:hypothetical protein